MSKGLGINIKTFQGWANYESLRPKTLENEAFGGVEGDDNNISVAKEEESDPDPAESDEEPL
jgi:hypothetical protein